MNLIRKNVVCNKVRREITIIFQKYYVFTLTLSSKSSYLEISCSHV